MATKHTAEHRRELLRRVLVGPDASDDALSADVLQNPALIDGAIARCEAELAAVQAKIAEHVREHRNDIEAVIATAEGAEKEVEQLMSTVRDGEQKLLHPKEGLMAEIESLEQEFKQLIAAREANAMQRRVVAVLAEIWENALRYDERFFVGDLAGATAGVAGLAELLARLVDAMPDKEAHLISIVKEELASRRAACGARLDELQERLVLVDDARVRVGPAAELELFWGACGALGAAEARAESLARSVADRLLLPMLAQRPAPAPATAEEAGGASALSFAPGATGGDAVESALRLAREACEFVAGGSSPPALASALEARATELGAPRPPPPIRPPARPLTRRGTARRRARAEGAGGRPRGLCEGGGRRLAARARLALVTEAREVILGGDLEPVPSQPRASPWDAAPGPLPESGGPLAPSLLRPLGPAKAAGSAGPRAPTRSPGSSRRPTDGRPSPPRPNALRLACRPARRFLRLGPAARAFCFHTVSRRAVRLLELLEAAAERAADATDAGARALFDGVRDALDLWRAALPARQAEALATVPTAAFLYYCDSWYLAHRCMTLGLASRQRLPEAARGSASLLDLAQPLRDAGDAAFAQATGHAERLGPDAVREAGGLEQASAPGRRGAIEGALREAAQRLRQLARLAGEVLPEAAREEAAGRAADSLLRALSGALRAVPDISESDSTVLGGLLGPLPAALQEAAGLGPEAFARGAPSLPRFSALSGLLDMPLQTILDRYFAGELPGFGRGDAEWAIGALFEGPKAAAALARVRSEPEPAGAAAPTSG
eukprot:tig00020592_g11636.t1